MLIKREQDELVCRQAELERNMAIGKIYVLLRKNFCKTENLKKFELMPLETKEKCLKEIAEEIINFKK